MAALFKKIRYALLHPKYLGRRITDPIYRVTNYDHGQWSRVVLYRELFEYVRSINPGSLDVLEIAPGGPNSAWRALDFRRYESVDYPDFDICNDKLTEKFDLIIADQVFEHLLWPYRAARNVHAMLKDGGRFITTTPFLIRVHDVPVDCSRWTELGIKHLLAEAGFDLSKIKTGSWGNRACVVANLHPELWASFGWGKNLQNEREFPVAVWAIAEK